MKATMRPLVLLVGSVLTLLLAAPSAGRSETLTLLDCLRDTMAHNALIIQQQLDIERASGTRLTYRSRALPNFSVNALLGQQGAENSQVLRIPAVRNASGQVIQPATENVTLRSAETFTIGSEALSQPVFDAAIPASWRRGGIEVAVAKANFAVIASAQLNHAHTLFLQALFAQQNGVIGREIYASQQNNVQTNAELVKAGLANRQALLTAQVQIANTQPGIFAATDEYRTTVAQLLQVMGRSAAPAAAGVDPVGTITLAGSLGEGPTDFDPVALGREAVARRPDLMALRETVRQLKEDANIARGGYYPVIRIYLNGQYVPQTDVRSDRPNAVRPGDNTRITEADPGAREDWTVIDTGAVRGNVNRIGFLRQAMEVSLLQAERIIPSQLAQIRTQWSSAQQQCAALTGNVGLAQNTLETIRGSLQQGLTSQLDFSIAQSDVAVARTGLLAAQLQASQARAEFDRVTGGYLRYVTGDRAESSPAAK